MEDALAAAGVPVPGRLGPSRNNSTGAAARPGGPPRNRSASTPASPSPADGPGSISPSSNHSEDEDMSEAARVVSQSAPEPLPPAPAPSSTHRRSKPPGSGLLSALSHSIHGIMDVDPEAARRSNISKTRDAISQVCPTPLLSFCFSLSCVCGLIGVLCGY